MRGILAVNSGVVLFLLLGSICRADIPLDGWIVWSSNRDDGRYEIYRMKADGSDVVRLTYTGGMVPEWSPDGRWVSYYCPSDSHVHAMHWDGSGDRKLCWRGPLDQGIPSFWMHDGIGLVCANLRGEDMEFYLTEPESCQTELLFRKNDFHHLKSTRFEPGGITHDGKWMVGWAFSLYSGGYQGDNGFFNADQATVILDLDDKSRIYFFGPGCQSATPPEGDWIYHVSREYPTVPDIARMQVLDVMTRESYQLELANADDQWGHEYMPSVSNDNKWMVYGATTGCHDLYDCDYEIFIHQLGSGVNDRTRLTHNSAGDNFPSIHIGELPVLPNGEDASCRVDSDEEQPHGENGDAEGITGGGCGCSNLSSKAELPLFFLLIGLLLCWEYRRRRDYLSSAVALRILRLSK